MRLQLTSLGNDPSRTRPLATVLLFVLLAAWPGAAVAAEPAAGGLSTRVDLYADEWITVVAPSMEAVVGPRDGRVSVRGHYTVDVVSGATQVMVPDATSSATHFDDVRHEAGLDATFRPRPEVAIGGGAVTSVEEDYTTFAGSVSLAGELFGRMATGRVSYGLSVEEAGLATDDPLSERTVQHQIDLSWVHILGRRTTLTALATGSWASCGEVLGCQPGPYRYVPITAGGVVQFVARERHPDRLGRGAISLRVAQGIGKGMALHAGYRLYGDTWRVVGHTVDLSLSRAFFGERLILKARGRFTEQGPVAFWRETYETDADSPTVPAYRSIDRELSGVRDVLAGGRVEWALPGGPRLLRLTFSVRLDHVWYWYPHFPAYPRRNAWIGGVGVDSDF